MQIKLRGGKWRCYSLLAFALTMVAAPGFSASEPGVNVVTHRFNSWDFSPLGPIVDAILNGEKHVRKKAGSMLADGDCGGAKDYALRKGRFDVADAVDRHCSAERARRALAMIPISRRVYLPPRAVPARPSLVAPVVINDYSVPTQR
ncbi:MAG: hypothetical protein J7498_10080 [Sphingobium sp.]|nr:hypothetical protein [Sphingobium sp.]